jgi:hypothetical protein
MSTGSWGAPEPQGPGWYQASDGLWYPPAGEAGSLVAQPGGVPGGTPIDVSLDAPLEAARWRPLVAWLLAIPHFVVLYVMGIIANICLLIGFFSVLFTKRVPPGVHDFLVRYYRYSWQVGSYALWMREDYPKWGGHGGDIDPGVDPARLSIQHADELQRFAPLYKWILLIPHYIALVFLGIGAFVAIVIGFFAVLFTGSWPEGLRTYIVGVMRWSTRVNAYILLRDEYPPFSLD